MQFKVSKVKDRGIIMTDEEILREYNTIIYNSDTYKAYTSSDWALNFFLKDVVSTEKKIKFFKLLLLASVYYFIYMFFSKANLIPFFFILIPAIFLPISKKNLVKSNKKLESITNDYYENKKRFEKLKQETPVPPIPSSMDNPQGVQELLAIFDSKRADTFKECLIIYQQDCQYKELMRRQNALISAANAAQREAEEAKKAAAKAQREADYARREADFHYWQNH